MLSHWVLGGPEAICPWRDGLGDAWTWKPALWSVRTDYSLLPVSLPLPPPSLHLVFVQIKLGQTGTKTPWGTMNSCDKGCNKYRLFWKAWVFCHLPFTETSALEGNMGSGIPPCTVLPTVFCRGLRL